MTSSFSPLAPHVASRVSAKCSTVLFLPDRLCCLNTDKMGTAPEEQIAAFKKFLTEFSALHPNPIAEEDAMPFRINTFRMSEDELEGECMDWVLEYLQERK